MVFEGLVLIWKVPRIVSNRVELLYKHPLITRVVFLEASATCNFNYGSISKLECNIFPTVRDLVPRNGPSAFGNRDVPVMPPAPAHRSCVRHFEPHAITEMVSLLSVR